MAEKYCDHTSVGMIVRRDDGLLLIERRKPPFGLAPPAGHVDEDTSYEAAAKRELAEEVGLVAVRMRLVLEADRNNLCRRLNGTWHHWKVYEVAALGNVRPCEEETRGATWTTLQDLAYLANRTRLYMDDRISDEAWQRDPGLEPVWYGHFQQLGMIDTVVRGVNEW